MRKLTALLLALITSLSLAACSFVALPMDPEQPTNQKQEQLADNAKKISEAGADLYNTCSILSGHFSSLGKSLNQAVAQYNKTVSSFEHRFIPRAQKLKNLGVTSTKELPRSLEDITEQAKSADVPDTTS